MSRRSKNLRYFLIALVLIILSAVVVYYLLSDLSEPIEDCILVGKEPKIHPDYSGAVIPPDIAPLNFAIDEDGLLYCAKIYSKNGGVMEIFSKSGKIRIPPRGWRRLLEANKGQQLYFDICVKKAERQWEQFSTVVNKIADENINSFLVYRKINPVHSTWREMGIYQRNLRNFDETAVLGNKRSFPHDCLNCHTFCNNRTDRMLIGIRSLDREKSGACTLFIDGSEVHKIDARFGYTSWHPSGKLAVYSINKVRQMYHTARNEVRDVIDLDSCLAYYLVDSGEIKIAQKLSEKDRLETYPAWSADGKYLYFCSAAILWSDRDKLPPDNYDKLKYDLRRVSYDVQTDQWGEVETVLSSEDTGLSISQPRLSPDGRWLLFCMSNYGSFLVYHKSSDLYLMDLEAAEQTGEFKYRRLDINSDESESWHSWSNNSRWIAFSSKRDYGVFTRIYISYVDEQGRAHEPVLLPQKDPHFYDSCVFTFSVPELVVEPVKVFGEKLARVVRGRRKLDITMPTTMATPTADISDAWKHHE